MCTVYCFATPECCGAGCEDISSVPNASWTLPTGKPKDEKRVEKRKRKESNRMMKQNAKYVRHTCVAIFCTSQRAVVGQHLKMLDECPKD